MGLSDAGDFVGQLVLEAVLGAQSRNNFARLATRLREAGLKVYEDSTAEVEKGKTSRPFSQSLEAYRGRYVNRAGNFVLDIALNEAEECLHMMLQSMEDVVYELRPYDGDTFYWPVDRQEELCRQQMFPWTWIGVHKVEFLLDGHSDVAALRWEHDPASGPDLFKKK